jgi:hypothetical protein
VRVLIIHLQKETDLQVVASLLMELGLFNTAIVDGEGIENIGVPQDQLFASFQNLFGHGSAYNRTLICPVPDQDTVKSFVHLCERQGLDFKNPETGWVLSFPCDIYAGPENKA